MALIKRLKNPNNIEWVPLKEAFIFTEKILDVFQLLLKTFFVCKGFFLFFFLNNENSAFKS